MRTSLYSSNSPALCICQAIGPGLPASGQIEIQDLHGLASRRLGDGHAGGSLLGVNHDFHLAPLVRIEF